VQADTEANALASIKPWFSSTTCTQAENDNSVGNDDSAANTDDELSLPVTSESLGSFSPFFGRIRLVLPVGSNLFLSYGIAASDMWTMLRLHGSLRPINVSG
jgi:hypothetical protein